MARPRELVVPAGYEVLRDGCVISHLCSSPFELTWQMDNSSNGIGYPSVRLFRDEKLDDGTTGRRRVRLAVHRLVAAVYLPPRPRGAFILHNDGNRMNPHADNLRWGTASENMYDLWRHRHMQELAQNLELAGM